LYPIESFAVIGDQIVAMVLSERERDAVAVANQRAHHLEFRTVADGLGVPALGLGGKLDRREIGEEV
jgi:hypothetical protein